MKQTTINRLMLLHCLCLIGLNTQGQNEISMQKYIEAGTPGSVHKKLGAFVGNWNTISEENQNDGKPPVINKGTAEIKWVNEGRFLHFTTTGKQFGLPFTSVSLIGYNNLRKKITSVWSDNSSTAFFITEGTIDETGTIITLYGKTDDPDTGEFDKNWQVIWRVTPDKLFQQYYDLSHEKPQPMFQIIYQKVK